MKSIKAIDTSYWKNKSRLIQVLGAVEISVQFSGATENIGGWIPKTRFTFWPFHHCWPGVRYQVLHIQTPKSRQQFIIYSSSPTSSFILCNGGPLAWRKTWKASLYSSSHDQCLIYSESVTTCFNLRLGRHVQASGCWVEKLWEKKLNDTEATKDAILNTHAKDDWLLKSNLKSMKHSDAVGTKDIYTDIWR